MTETFILGELLELERRGVTAQLFAFVKEEEEVAQPHADRLAARAYYGWPPTPSFLASQLFWMRTKPRRYARAWARAVRGNARSPRMLLRALAVVPTAAHFAREVLRLDIVHVHAHWATHPALAALVIKELTGVTYSLTAHAHDLYVDRSMLGEKIAGAEFVITVSEYNRNLLTNLYGPSAATKTTVIRCGIDPAVFHPPDHSQSPHRPTDDGFRIVCVASLEPYKGHRYLLEAVALLAEQEVPVQCVLVGDGEERGRLEATATLLGVNECVEFRGRQRSDEVREALASADVMVLPSVVTARGKKEGIPVALMEALSMAVPVVATQISGVPELVEHGRTGLLVPERDSAALASAILELFRSPERRRAMGRAGRQKVLSEYDLRRNVERLHGLLNAHLHAASAASTLWD